MKEALPLYVVKCLTAAGFDSLEVIAEMDVSGDSGNSIEQIEQFISEKYPDDIMKRQEISSWAQTKNVSNVKNPQ